MNRIFLDANILIDLISKRATISEIIKLSGEIQKGIVYTSALSIHIAVYILKIKPNTMQMNAIHKLSQKLNIIPLSNVPIQLAFDTGYKDYEDMLQYFSAIDFCDTIITKDIKDFENIQKLYPSKIKIMRTIQ